MPFETLTTAPAIGDFTPLQEHQEQTPGTFFDGKPVLHLHAADVQLLVSHADLADQSVFPDLRAAAPTNGAAVNGSASDDTPLAIPNLSVWVTSKNLLIHSPSADKGVSIPYPTITLHAIQRLTPPAAPTETSGLYMQLLLNASDHTPDDDLQTLEITLIPSPATPIADLFAAVSACADLNPDPQDTDSEAGDDDDGGLQVLGGGAGLPGAGGWITSENVGEHVDTEGNFVGFGGGGASLGAGAGTVHGRDDEGEDEAGEEAEGEASGEAGAGAGGEDAKWRRTE